MSCLLERLEYHLDKLNEVTVGRLIKAAQNSIPRRSLQASLHDGSLKYHAKTFKKMQKELGANHPNVRKEKEILFNRLLDDRADTRLERAKKLASLANHT